MKNIIGAEILFEESVQHSAILKLILKCNLYEWLFLFP